MKTGKSNMQHKLALLTLFLVAFSGSAISKDFYRWKDAEGVTHYSEKPPRDASATKVRATNTKMPADGYSPSSPKPTEKAQESTAAASANDKERNAQRCEAAQKNAKTLQEKNRIRIKDDNGEYRYLDQNEIAEKLKMARQIIDEEC